MMTERLEEEEDAEEEGLIILALKGRGRRRR